MPAVKEEECALCKYNSKNPSYAPKAILYIIITILPLEEHRIKCED